MKDLLRRWLLKQPTLRRPAVRYCVDNQLLPSILTRIPSHELRRMWNLPASAHYTQLNQDIFALMMRRFQSGYFVEIGANDGFTLSNTQYLEEHFGWTGLLVEANSKYEESLLRRSNSKVVMKAICDNRGSAKFVDAGLYGGLSETLDATHSKRLENATQIVVSCGTLDEILTEAGAPSTIDFVSIDVEGGELPIVRQLAMSDRRFVCGCIEFNYRKNDYREMQKLLSDSGYRIVWAGQTLQDLYFLDQNFSI